MNILIREIGASIVPYIHNRWQSSRLEKHDTEIRPVFRRARNISIKKVLGNNSGIPAYTLHKNRKRWVTKRHVTWRMRWISCFATSSTLQRGCKIASRKSMNIRPSVCFLSRMTDIPSSCLLISNAPCFAGIRAKANSTLINFASCHGKRVGLFFSSPARECQRRRKARWISLSTALALSYRCNAPRADYGVDSGYVMAKADWRVLIYFDQRDWRWNRRGVTAAERMAPKKMPKKEKQAAKTARLNESMAGIDSRGERWLFSNDLSMM